MEKTENGKRKKRIGELLRRHGLTLELFEFCGVYAGIKDSDGHLVWASKRYVEDDGVKRLQESVLEWLEERESPLCPRWG
jgi:hypothetical protein